MRVSRCLSVQEITKVSDRCGSSGFNRHFGEENGPDSVYSTKPHPNQCEIAVPDLEPFLPGHLPGQGEEPLENRVAALEQQVQQLLTRSARSGLSSQQKRERTTGPLPVHLVSVLAFAELHRIPEQKVLTHLEISLLPVHKGAWTDHDGHEVALAFDAKGRQAFHCLYHESPWFTPCMRCPHALPGHV